MHRLQFLVKVSEGALVTSTAAVDLEQKCPLTLCGLVKEDDVDPDEVDDFIKRPVHLSRKNEDGAEIEPAIADLMPLLRYYIKEGTDPANKKPLAPEDIRVIPPELIQQAVAHQ